MNNDNKRFNHINDTQRMLDSMWDWSPYDRCFPRGSRIMDIDGMVELNRSFHFIETKAINVSIPAGQLLALRRLSQLPQSHVTVIYGDANQPEAMQQISNGRVGKIITCNNGQLTHYLMRWAAQTERYNK